MRIFDCPNCLSGELKYSPWAGFPEIMEPKEYYWITCLDCGTITYVDAKTDKPLSKEQRQQYGLE